MYDASSGASLGQTQANLKCLVIAAQSHGLNLSVSRIVQDNSLSDGPVSTKDLLRCARRAGLTANVVKVRPGLRQLKDRLPAIVVLKSGASMVMVGFHPSGNAPYVQLRDPEAVESPVLTVDQLRFEEACADEAILIRRGYDLSDEEQPFGFGLLKSLLFRERRLVRDLAISAAILSLIALAPMIFWRLLTDRVLERGSMNTFVLLCIGMGVIIVCESILDYMRSYFITVITTRVDIRILEYVYDKLLRLRIEFFERTPAGQIGHYIMETYRIRVFLIESAFGTILDSMILLVFLPVVFLYSLVVGTVLVTCCGLIVLFLIVMLPTSRRVTGAVVAAETARGSFLYQTLQGMRTVKSLALETRQRRQWDFHVSEIVKLRLKQGFVLSLTAAGVQPLERFAVQGSFALAIFMGSSLNDPLLLGALFAVYVIAQRAVAPLMGMAKLVNSYDEARMAVKLAGKLANQTKEESASGRGVRTALSGRIQFRNLRFKYRGTANYALDGVTFAVPLGQTLGIVGRSGSGKTTVTRLLQHLHSEYEGSIEIDGVEVREYDVAHLRRSLGVVLQENFLFTGSIRENIAAAKPHATFEEVVRVARLAGAEEFIDKLPRGYETHIYEGSPNLSGGQKQRLAIARALIVDPRILILDEATSALDPDSEAIVNENIRRIAQGRTVIVITHRLSSVANSDAILVLERGKVVDLGKHYELLERCEIYAGLWNQQNRHIVAASRSVAMRGPLRVS